MTRNRQYILFSILLLVIFSWAVWDSIDFQPIARHYPLYLGSAAIILIIIDLVLYIRTEKENSENNNSDISDSIEWKSSLKYIAWIVGYLITMYVFGFIISTTLFLLFFLKLEAKMNWLKSILVPIGIIIIVMMFNEFVGVNWPSGMFDIL